MCWTFNECKAILKMDILNTSKIGYIKYIQDGYINYKTNCIFLTITCIANIACILLCMHIYCNGRRKVSKIFKYMLSFFNVID